jgi:hypothetical protein
MNKNFVVVLLLVFLLLMSRCRPCEYQTISTLSLLDSLRVGNSIYRGVMHFCCLDLAEEWEDHTVKEIYLAKNYGPIQHKLQNGLVYSRD